MRYIFTVLFILFTGLVSAQKQSLKFSHILPENGLSHSFVTSIVQDSRGFMWFGTKDGLNKYDGYTITIYKNDPDKPQSLSHNFIQDLIFDHEGNLWIASWGGLSKFDVEKEIFIQYRQNPNDPSSIPNDLLSCVYEDLSGNLWLGSAGGLILFDRKKSKFITYRHDKNDPESLSDDYVRDIHMDSKHRLWVGTYSGGLSLFNLKTGKFKRYQLDEKNKNSIGNNCAYTIFEDSKKRLWIGSHIAGFDLFDPENGKFTHYQNIPGNPNSLAHNSVACFGEDSKGNIWVGTENGGLSIFNPEKNEFYNHKHDDIDNTTIGNNSLYNIYRDKKGNMWVGTFADGVNFLSLEASRFQHFRHNSSLKSLSNNNVLSFYEDSEKNLWIGTDGGGANLYNRKAGTMTSFQNVPGNINTIAGNYVLTISEDSEHNMWFGTWGAGISIWNPKTNTFRHLRNNPSDPSSLNSNNSWYIYRDRENRMWVGTYRGGGLDLYDKATNSFVHFSNNPEDSTTLNNHYINSIFEDSKGNFWIGTSGGGLNLMDRNTRTFKAFKRNVQKNCISSNIVDCVFEDSKGNLWIGSDLGLNLMDPVTRKFKTFTSKDGLPSDVVYGIQEDKRGFIWISTTKGLSKLNVNTNKFSNYTIADGLQSAEFKPHASLHSSMGAMYFGGINGYNEFYPDSLSDKEPEFPLYITSFKIFNKEIIVGEKSGKNTILSKAISQANEIILSHNQSFFSFEFASLNYSVPEKNQYAYMLEGFDEDWNYIGSRRLATYTDVPPGTYLFKVKASHNNGKWKNNEASIKITINPPFWDTWWFKILAVLFITSAAVSFVTYRIKTIKSQKEDLERQVKARTIDLQVASREIEKQRDSLRNANEHVMSSINYANTIQKAILAANEKIEATVSDYFIIYKPKDVVSGDFYWFSNLFVKEGKTDPVTGKKNLKNKKFIAAVDCTGHGVSGAFMSIIGNTLLNEIINLKYVFDPAEILEALDEGLKRAINPADGVAVAGMDVCLCKLENMDTGFVKVSFSGARRPLYFVRKGTNEVEKISGHIISIGSDFKEGECFETQEFILEKGSVLYLTSDGFADQHNANNKKIGSSKFKKLLESIAHLPLSMQKEAMEIYLSEHQQAVEQRDDITIIGVRI